jgi:Uri superfamily endonuclease
MDKGIYCLVFKNPRCTLRVGALGEIAFRRGWHIYVGSALGSGGLARLERHVTMSRNKDRRPTWHVDYLLTSGHVSLKYTIAASTAGPLECELARAVGGSSVPDFGSSDCDCPSHLFFRRTRPVHEVEGAFRKCGLVPVTATIMNRQHRKGYL